MYLKFSFDYLLFPLLASKVTATKSHGQRFDDLLFPLMG
jgi:hypothetical protein